MTAIANRYEFVLLFDVKDGNPNGDPDGGNTPRIDPETGNGLVTDVALKRKIRNFIAIKHQDNSPYSIYVREGSVLQEQRRPAYEKCELANEGKKTKKEAIAKAREFMCHNFFDVRAFGAVMSMDEFNAGQVRGPVQLTFARSIDRIQSQDHTITRVAFERKDKADATTGQTEMGSKSTVAYGLYQAHGFISPHLADGAKGTGFSEADLDELWQALTLMFDHDRSAARGLMATRKLIVFKHESKLGNAPAAALLERVKAIRRTDAPPRAFTDYEVTVDETNLPQGVSVQHLV